VASDVVDHTGLRLSVALRTNMRCAVSLFRYNPEIRDNPEFLPDGAQWARESDGSAPTLLRALLSARNRATSPTLSQLLQTDPTGAAHGTNQAQVPTDSFDSPGQPSVTPAQYWGPFIEAIKPGFEFGMDTLGARKPNLPNVPRLPDGTEMADPVLGKHLQWGRAMDAKRWVQDMENDPVFADQLAKNFQDIGGTKDMLDQWGNWYGEMFRQNPTKEQFWWRSQGLEKLKDRLPSAPPASTPSSCPPGWECT